MPGEASRKNGMKGGRPRGHETKVEIIEEIERLERVASTALRQVARLKKRLEETK